MYQDFFNRNDDYLNEFKQKVANQKIAALEERRSELAHSRNNFFGTLAGITLAGIVGWFVLAPQYAESDKEIPVIRRPQSAVKIKPEDPKGMQIPNRDKDVYNIVEKKEVDNTVVENLLPAPEKPKLPDIVPEVSDINTDAGNLDEIVNEVAETPNAEKAAPAEKMNNPTKEAKGEMLPEKPKDLLADTTQTPAGQEKTETAEKNIPDSNMKTAEKTPEKIPAPAAATSAPAGNWQIQLIASKNQSAVEKAWTTMSAKYAELKNLPHEIQTSDLGSQGMFYRLRAGAFASKEEAQKFCAGLKTKGLADCIAKEK